MPPKLPKLPGLPEPPEPLEDISNLEQQADEALKGLEAHDPLEAIEKGLSKAQQRLDSLADVVLRPVGKRRKKG
jgi:hypothetical protein